MMKKDDDEGKGSKGSSHGVKGGVGAAAGALTDAVVQGAAAVAVDAAIGDPSSVGGKIGKAVVKGAAKIAADAVVSKVEGWIDKAISKPIETVSYEVRIEGGPDLEWHVRRFHLVEAISEPYEMALDLISEHMEGADLIEELLGADLVLTYGRDDFSRHIAGVIEQADLVGIESDRLTIRVRVVPALRALAQRVTMRHFQDLDVPTILEQVLGPALGEYGRELDRSKLNEGYLVRDYCVQYGESDLAFVHRLMAEEGISYFFEFDEDKGVEKMVFADQNDDEPNSDYPRVDGVIDDTIHIIADRAELADVESIRYLDWQLSEQVTKVSTRRFNWKRPDPEATPESEQEDEKRARGRTREVYAPDERRRIEDKKGDEGYAGTGVEEDEDDKTKKFFQMMSAGRERGQGASNVTGMRAGGVFQMDDHPHPNVAMHEVLVVRVVHFGDCPDEESHGGGGGGERYQNSFECIPVHAVFRPGASASRPRIYGAQTATVVGPGGEEIHTDAHGRIKVKFHWDRDSAADASASCWVRVAQMWGGAGWGTWYLPRIGMEVVVQFLDGNPDRPLVVGCVYNGSNAPPVTLPDDKTQTTIKTRSSKGGGGFNELRFEDLAGNEEVFIHAQKDLREVVLNNRNCSVGSNEAVTIDGNQTVVVKGAPANGDAGDNPGQAVVIDGQHRMTASKEVIVNSEVSIHLEVKGTMVHVQDDRIELCTSGGAQLILEGANIHLNP